MTQGIQIKNLPHTTSLNDNASILALTDATNNTVNLIGKNDFSGSLVSSTANNGLSNDENGLFVPIQTGGTVDQTYSGTSANAQSGVSILGLLKTIYPVGCVYLTTNSTCPLSSLFGTWSLVSSGKALWTGTGSNGNTTISAGLPNISGTWQRDSDRNVVGGNDAFSGALGRINLGKYRTFGDSVNSFNGGNLSFSAQNSNSIYGSSTTVQPPAYVVNVFRRTA